tara:strand:- start:115 stop:588 length:474 start_codon:yes stop_codon:yes gene_type:complete
MENYKIMYGERESHVKAYKVSLEDSIQGGFGYVEVRGYLDNGDIFTLSLSSTDMSITISEYNGENPELFLLEKEKEWDEISPHPLKYIEIQVMPYVEELYTLEEWVIVSHMEDAYHRHYNLNYTLFDRVCDEFQIDNKKVETPHRDTRTNCFTVEEE